MSTKSFNLHNFKNFGIPAIWYNIECVQSKTCNYKQYVTLISTKAHTSIQLYIYEYMRLN